MKPLTIAAFLDGRPGHEKQTRAILQALADITATNVIFKKVSVSHGVYLKNWAIYLFSFLLNTESEKFNTSVDLFIGTGTYTHIPMLLGKKECHKIYDEQVRVVTCMSPEPILLRKFDLCCIPAHDNAPVRDNVFVTVGPPTSIKYEKRHKPGRGLILIGGVDSKSHKWDSRAVAQQIHTIIKKNPGIHWTASSSPRTPEDTCKELETLGSIMDKFSFFRSENTPEGWVEKQYAENGTVWVTADSISMVYEALNAGCSVGILPVEWLHKENKFQRSLDILRDKNMIVEFNSWQDGAKMPEPPAEPVNEALRCAREILQRWWPDRLQ